VTGDETLAPPVGPARGRPSRLVDGAARVSAWPLFVVGVAIGGILLVALIRELTVAPADSAYHDFLAFFAAGKLVLDGHGSLLYGSGAVTAIQRSIIPHSLGANGYMPFINPPFAATVFVPLAALPEPLARGVWAAISLALASVAAAWIVRPLSGRQRTVGFILVLSSYPAFHALAEGQWSFVLLLAGLAALGAARAGRWRLAGAALGVLWIKPQLVVLPLAGLLLARRWTSVAVAVLVGAALAAATLTLTGPAVYGQYLTYLADVVLSHFTGAGAVHQTAWRGDLTTAEGLNGLLVGVFGQRAVGVVDLAWAAGSALLVGLFLLASRARRPGFAELEERLMLAAGIALVLLVNPNLFAQDTVLVFLVVAALLPVPGDAGLLLLAAVTATADLVFLDLTVEPWHIFTLVLLLGFVSVCLVTITRAGTRQGMARAET